MDFIREACGWGFFLNTGKASQSNIALREWKPLRKAILEKSEGHSSKGHLGRTNEFCFCVPYLFPNKWQLLLDDLLHLLLDTFQVFSCDCLWSIKVIVKASLYPGSNCDLCTREESLHAHCHDVRTLQITFFSEFRLQYLDTCFLIEDWCHCHQTLKQIGGLMIVTHN